MKRIIKKALLTEKSYLNQESGAYTFLVNSDANKIEITKAVEETFGVKVKSVNIINTRAKSRALRGSRVHTKRAAAKKALVTLADKKKLDVTKLK